MNIRADINREDSQNNLEAISDAVPAFASIQRPLVVDLDGTLIQSDLLVEQSFALLGDNPQQAIGLCQSFARGKAALKRFVAEKQPCRPDVLPYNSAVIAEIEAAKAAGRKVYLASASNERYVNAIAAHIGLFDGTFASDDTRNLSSRAKADLLVREFGEKGFDYIGNSADDLSVWAAARHCIGINLSTSVERKLRAISPDAQKLDSPTASIRTWLRLLRVHQWSKNALLFVPLMAAQKFDVVSIASVLFAFLMFSLAASSIYLINDLADLQADRAHPEKRKRPLAAGKIPLINGLIAAPLLLLLSLGGSLLLPIEFTGILLLYITITTAYTFVLKRKMIVDVITLAGLYTVRVVAGSAAVSVVTSEWLLAFSMFIFTSLALIKRYVELATRLDADLPDPSNRNYRKSDLDIVATLAAAAGFNAVTVFALYISSDTVQQLYSRPFALWFVCPVLLYWLGRALMMAHRRFLHDDPIMFAIKDRNSLVCFGLISAIILFAH